MAGSAFDLEQFAPDHVDFTIGKGDSQRTYWLNGNPDVDVVARMLRVEEQIRDSETTEQTVAAVQEGKRLIVELIHDVDVDQDASTLKLNTQQVLTLFALVLHGSSVASIVAKAISMPDRDVTEDGRPVATAEDGEDDEGEEGKSGPLVSASISPERSSLSDGRTDGLPDTGSG